ncbi:MAG: mannose-6-phosphate isomerase, partial [Kitasatospora sp.]|nr:mannose-6-phosphate isomerase [Kitasatospora sp.]
MLDESLLDDPAALARADTHGALRGAAEAGARVRTAARLAAESGQAALRPDGRPRALFVAGPGPATDCTAGLLDALLAGA